MRPLLIAVLVTLLLAATAHAQQIYLDTAYVELLPLSPPVFESTSHLVSRKDSIASARARRAAGRSSAMRVVVSIGARRLWVVSGADTLLDAPVAVGMGRTLSYAGRRWTFATPIGVRKVLMKRSTPYWRPPDWAYAEVAASMGCASSACGRSA